MGFDPRLLACLSGAEMKESIIECVVEEAPHFKVVRKQGETGEGKG